MYTIVLNPMSYKNDDNSFIISDTSFVTEWEINYTICKLIEEKLLKYSDIEVIYTTQGERLHISERLDIINSMNDKNNIVIGIQSTNIVPSKVQYTNMNLGIIGDTIAHYIDAEIKSDAVHRKLCTSSYIHIILANEVFTKENKLKFATDIVNAIVVSLNLKDKKYKKQCYTVRKSSNDINFQSIKTFDIKIAKEYCDSKVDYNIYDEEGNLVYKSALTKVNTKQKKSKIYGIVNNNTMLYIDPNRSGIIPIYKNTRVELLSRKDDKWMILYNNNIFYINKQYITT